MIGFLDMVRRVFGILEARKTEVSTELMEKLISLIVDVREILRREKRYDLSDMIRSRLREVGVELQDTAEGPRWRLLERSGISFLK